MTDTKHAEHTADEVFEAVAELLDIREVIEEKLDEAIRIVRKMNKDEANRAECYWYAHVKTALRRDTEYLGCSMTTMQDTIDTIEGDAEEKEFDLEEDYKKMMEEEEAEEVEDARHPTMREEDEIAPPENMTLTGEIRPEGPEYED